MNIDLLADDDFRLGRQNSSNNNQSHVPDDNQGLKTSFSHLSNVEKEILVRGYHYHTVTYQLIFSCELRDAGFLYGFLVNSKDGPRRSTQSVFKLKNSEQNLSLSVQECNNLVTNIIPTYTDRDSNFAHQGWSASSISTSTPWIASRITNSNQTLWENAWVTKRVVVQRLAITVSLRDLEPAPEFEEEVLAALEKASRPERFQALDKAFQHWGDVIPLALDLGISLSITDRREKFDQASNSNNGNDLHNLTTFKTGIISTQGGEATFLPEAL